MATVTTNTLWIKYLNSLGYSGSLNDMLVQALRFYSGSDRKSLNDLWNIYLTSEGVRGSSVSTKLYNYLANRGYTASSLDTRIRQALIAGDVFVPAVDKSALVQAIADAESLNESDYTPESWALLEGALIAGHQVNDDPNATQPEVDQAEQEIRDAIAQLVPVPDVCVATLTHDIVDADPSYLPADIDGNQFSLTFPTPGFDQYAASTSISDLKSLPASGTVWVEFRRSGVPAGVGLQFIDAVSTDTVNFLTFGNGFETVQLYEGGSFVGGAQLDSLGEVDSLMVGYNSAGELFVMDQYGVPRNVTEFPVDGTPLPPAPLSGFTAIAFVGAIIGSTELTGTAFGQFVTDHEQFPYPPEGEAYDWCGGQIPTLPVYKGGLAQALTDAGELDPLEYTSATWSDVESAITAGQLVLDDDEATQLDVNNAIRTITTSINNLVEWTPAEEFSNGEQGVWFDPSDLTTLYQDSNGQTPVTGNGQPVGLMLDKSQGLQLGPEMSTPYDSGRWLSIGSSPGQWSVVGPNEAGVDNTGGTSSSYLRDNEFGMESGRTYLLEFEVLTSNGVGGLRLTNGTDNVTPIILTTGPVSFIFRAGGVNSGVFGTNALSGWVGSISSISVKELPGHHRTQGTTAAKPTYLDGVLDYDNVDDYLPWMPPKYTGMISMAIAYRLNSGSNYQGWSSMVNATGNVFGLSRTGDAGAIIIPLSWRNSLIRVNGEEVDPEIYRRDNLYDDAVSGECIGVVEGVDWNLGNPGVDTTPRQTIRYANQPSSGGTEFAYIEVEKPAFDDLPRLEHWLAKKAGVTL